MSPFNGYPVDSFHTQSKIDGYSVIMFQGSNVVGEVDCLHSRSHAEAVGNRAKQSGTTAAYELADQD